MNESKRKVKWYEWIGIVLIISVLIQIINGVIIIGIENWSFWSKIIMCVTLIIGGILASNVIMEFIRGNKRGK